jgi:hypothetical protein
VLSRAQHWEDLDRLMDPILRLRLIVSNDVCAFISSRDSRDAEICIYTKLTFKI